VKLHRIFLPYPQISTRHISLRILDRSASAASAQTVRLVAVAADAPGAACPFSGSLGETVCESWVAVIHRNPCKNICDPLLCDVLSHFTPDSAYRGCLPFESFVWRGNRELATNTFVEHGEQVRWAKVLDIRALKAVVAKKW